MPNLIKYSTTAQTLALRKANYWIGTGDVTKGPTSTTDYWNGITPPTSGYTIYQDKGGNGPSIYVPTTDADLIFLTNQIANSNIIVFTSTTQCFSYFFGQVDKMVVNIDYPSITTSGLTLNLDPGFLPSYPRSGTTINDVSPSGNNGTLVNGVGYSTSGGGALQFSAASNQYLTTNYVVPGTTFTLSVWFNISTVSGYNTVLIINVPNYQLLAVKEGSPNTFEFWSSDIAAGLNLGSPNISTNTWYNVTYVREGNNITNGYKAYWNGLFTGAQNTVTWAAGTSTIWIANRSNVSQPFNGLIANAMVYTRALSASEILQNYNAMVVSRFLWSPSVLSPALWLDASDSTTIIQSGGAVSQWNDKSGNSRNFANATADQRPIYSVSSFSGRPGITFDGSNDTLTITGLGSLFNNTTHGIYYVMQRVGAGTGDSYRPDIASISTAGTGTDVGALHYIRTDNNGASYPYFNTAGSYDGISTGYANNTPYVFSFQSNTTGWGVWRNGTLESTTSSLTAPTTQADGYALARQFNPSRASNIVISEIVFAQNVTTANRQIIEGYLAWKWGLQTSLPTNHPYYTSPPVIGS